MRPPMVANPFPEQKRPWRHVCNTCGTKMVRNLTGGGIHCPTCHPAAYDAQLRIDDDAP